MHVVLAGGGTAGHVQPALALADALRREDPSIGITFLGTQRGLESRLLPARGYGDCLALIPAVPLPRKLQIGLLAIPRRVVGAVTTAGGVLDRLRADVVVGFGGYVAAPAYVAAWRRRVPIVVHEANPYPGLANRLGARLTEWVAVAHAETSLPRATHIGIPLSRSVAGLDRAAEGEAARAHFGLRADLPTLLVFGGSQGARSLNRAASGAAHDAQAAGIQVLHVAGVDNPVEVGADPAGPPYVIVPYVDRMELAYAAADFALCRAGALTCAELTAVGLPAGYVPFPFGNGEQQLNARPIVRAGGGVLVADHELTPDWIRHMVVPLLADPQRLARMSEAAAGLGYREADTALARMALQAGAQSGKRSSPRSAARATPAGGESESAEKPEAP